MGSVRDFCMSTQKESWDIHTHTHFVSFSLSDTTYTHTHYYTVTFTSNTHIHRFIHKNTQYCTHAA